MNQKTLNIIMIGLFIYILYKQNCLAKEQFSYQEPTQAIKNLGKLAKQLTTGGLTIPGNVNITGNLNVGIPDKNGIYNGTVNANMLHGDTCFVNHVKCTNNVKANMLHGDTCFVNHVNCTGDVKARIIKAKTQVDTGTLFSNHIKTNFLTSYKNLTVGNNLYVDGAANITKTLGVQGTLNAHSDLHVKGNVGIKAEPNISYPLTMNGNASVNYLSADSIYSYNTIEADDNIITEGKFVKK